MTKSSDSKRILLLILLAFIFSFSLRLIWIYQFNDVEAFKFNDQFMLTTNDGYYYAEGANDIISQNKEHYISSPIEKATSVLTAFLYKILPFSLETIIFYMPAFFSSLIVIPLILIGKELNRLDIGFIAALIASIAVSYYNRSMVGYYDTDMLNIVFPMVLIWSLIGAVKTNNDKYLIIAAFDIIAYRWWYPQSYALEFAFIALFLVYLVYLFYIHKDKEPTTKYYSIPIIAYNIQLITIMILAMVQLDTHLRFMLVIGYFMLFRQERWHKHLYIMFVMVLIIFFASGGFDPIWSQLKNYVFKDTVTVIESGLNLHYFTVMQTIKEASAIPFETFANRISGTTISFILATIGYIWLLFKYRVMILTLPMLGLGFLTNGFFGLVPPAGLRFTIYAVPVLALALAFLISEIGQKVIKNNILRYSFITFFTLLALVPHILHIVSYKIPTVFLKNDVIVFDKIKEVSKKGDYVVSWWDYGYPIRFYTQRNTLIDGGKHSGRDNFLVSYSLLSSQEAAAKMARLNIEYNEKLKKINQENEKLEDEKKVKFSPSIEQMTQDYGFDDTNDFLTYLETDLQIKEKTKDIYFYLPSRTMEILPVIDQFSNIDLMNGKEKTKRFFYSTKDVRETKNILDLGNNVKVLKDEGRLVVGNKKVNINRFIITDYNSKNGLQKSISTIDSEALISLIYIKHENKFVLVDEELYESLYIQLYVLENYNDEIFEPIILNPRNKVYKLKI